MQGKYCGKIDATSPASFLDAAARKLGFEVRDIGGCGIVQYIVIDAYVNAPVFMGSTAGSGADKQKAVLAFMQKAGAPKATQPI